MRTPFTERTQVRYTTNDTKIYTYKEHKAYCITYQTPGSNHNALAYYNRAEAMHRLDRVLAENGGVTNNA